jgi:hypothetical protein
LAGVGVAKVEIMIPTVLSLSVGSLGKPLLPFLLFLTYQRKKKTWDVSSPLIKLKPSWR